LLAAAFGVALEVKGAALPPASGAVGAIFDADVCGLGAGHAVLLLVVGGHFFLLRRNGCTFPDPSAASEVFLT
jgi:hypothetical protein